MQMERFFDELAPSLETAKALDRKLDRKLAHRFNVVDYLKTNELGLSRIIADLLHPRASHGQGMLFLRAFLEKLEGFRETLRWPDLDGRTSVRCEEKITGERRIDVVVEVKGPAGETHSLVLENKPYAHDQESQVKDYLDSREKDDMSLLIYLSPRGGGPSESSISKDELWKRKERFAIMPYVGGQKAGADGFEDFRLRHSLADWLGECRKSCDVDRLRWFLRDMETFCQRRFGGQAMSSDCQTKTVQDFVDSDPLKLKTAKTVYEAWPAIQHEECSKFLQQLAEKTTESAKKKEKLAFLEVKSRYEVRLYRTSICLYRESWAQYENSVQYEGLSGRRSAVCLTCNTPPKDWMIAVWNPVPVNGIEAERGELLAEKLNGLKGLGPAEKPAPGWPWWKKVEEHKNWDSLVLDLHQECLDGSGGITDYYVNKVIEVAEKAVPIIDQIEGDTTA